MAPTTVVRARLRPPRIPTGAVERLRLIELGSEGVERGRLLVTAGAGYGKSTFVAQLISTLDLPWAWCTCDARMGDPVSLLGHVTAALGAVVPGLGGALALRGTAEDATLALCNEIDETVTDDVVLVMDDAHALIGGPSEAVVRLLEADLPPQVRLVVSSRTDVGLPLARLRASGAIEVGEQELALTPPEAESFLAGAGVGDLDEAKTNGLHAATEGWPAGLLIAAKSGLDPGRAQRKGGPLFDYLAEEVLANTPADIVQFLEGSSVLARFTPEMAGAVAEEPNAAATIDQLVAGHLFTIPLDVGEETWFRYHALLRSHLRGRLDASDPERLRVLHSRAADVWLERGEPAEAVPHLLAARDDDRALSVIEPIAEGLVRAGEVDTVARWLEQLPREDWWQRPSLVLSEARIQNAAGRFELSVEAGVQALAALLDAGDGERAALASCDLVLSMVSAGMPPTRRIEIAEPLFARLPDSPMLPAVWAFYAGTLAYAGRREEGVEMFRRARAGAAASPLPVLVYADALEAFYMKCNDGEPERGVEMIEGALAAMDALPREMDLLALRGIGGIPLTIILNSLGRYEEALEAVERTIRVSESYGIRNLGRTMLWSRASALAGLERWDELDAIQALPARPLVSDEHTHYSYRLRGPAALLAAARGNTDAVAGHAAAAIEEMERHGVGFDTAWIRCDISKAAYSVGLNDLAAQLADDAREQAIELGIPWARARSGLLAAAAQNFAESGDPFLTDALDVTQEFGFTGLWSRRERNDAGPALARALAANLGPPGLAARLVADCGAEVAEACAAILAGGPSAARRELADAIAGADTVPPDVVEKLLDDESSDVREAASRAQERSRELGRLDLEISVLGGLRVERGGVAVPPSRFGRKKARALLGALVCAGGPVHRDQLLEWLWPDLPPDRGTRAFHVTLHALRRALEPDLSRRETSRTVPNDGETYRLAIGDGDRVDVFRLLEIADAAPLDDDSRLDDLLEAESLLHGAPLPEWEYEEWAAELRDRVASATGLVLLELGERLAAADRHREAVSRFERLLEIDPEREQAHRGLMSAHAAAGERSLALRQFHACRRILSREQGVEPSDETQALYRELLG